MARSTAKLKSVFIGAVALMLLAQLGLALGIEHFWGIAWALFFYFVAFNVLEASLPSLISKMAPASAKGTAMGVYNTAQAFGLFFGGVFGGWLAQHHGFASVFIFCLLMMAAWLFASSVDAGAARNQDPHVPGQHDAARSGSAAEGATGAWPAWSKRRCWARRAWPCSRSASRAGTRTARGSSCRRRTESGC
jgi:MFS family permease